MVAVSGHSFNIGPNGNFYFPRNKVVGGYTGFTMSVRLTENRIFTVSYDNLSSVSQNVLKFYHQLTGEERRIPFIFDDFHFCRSRVIERDVTENRIFNLCRMITWVVFLRMFWNFISSLPVKRGGSLSFLVGTISKVLVMVLTVILVKLVLNKYEIFGTGRWATNNQSIDFSPSI